MIRTLFLCAALPTPLLAEQLPAGEGVRPVIRAFRVSADQVIAVDGRLNESAWQVFQ